MPRHIARLLMLMIIAALAAYGAKRYFTDVSFYEYGHYRGNSVAELASDKPKYKGTAYCESCHAERFAEWSAGVHNNVAAGKAVKCEVCHGPAGARDFRGMFVNSATGPDHPQNLKLAIPTDTRGLCTLCHEKMPGRPAQQRQIVIADHAGEQQCTVCHNAHSPRLNLPPAAAAVPHGDATLGKTKAEACIACHGAEGVSVDLPGPTLAGQKAAYIVDAFKTYGTGERNNPIMGAVVENVSIEDIGDLAAYFTGLRCDSSLKAEKQSMPTDPPAAVSKCTACHGADGMGGSGPWPNLVGNNKDYLLAALSAYRDGTRKNVTMAAIVKDLSEADAEAAASYYADAKCK